MQVKVYKTRNEFVSYLITNDQSLDRDYFWHLIKMVKIDIWQMDIIWKGLFMRKWLKFLS